MQYIHTQTLEILSSDELEDRFDDYLDETTGEIKIIGVNLLASSVLRETDPVAYRCGLIDFIDAQGFSEYDYFIKHEASKEQLEQLNEAA